MISLALNSLTAIEMDNDTIIGIIQSAIEKDKVIEKNFKEDKVVIKTHPSYIAISYKMELS